jgi:hypothetical protein
MIVVTVASPNRPPNSAVMRGVRANEEAGPRLASASGERPTQREVEEAGGMRGVANPMLSAWTFFAGSRSLGEGIEGPGPRTLGRELTLLFETGVATSGSSGSGMRDSSTRRRALMVGRSPRAIALSLRSECGLRLPGLSPPSPAGEGWLGEPPAPGSLGSFARVDTGPSGDSTSSATGSVYQRDGGGATEQSLRS